MKTAATLIALAGAAGFAAAQTTTYGGGAGGAINDTLGALSSSIVITDGGTIDDLDLNLNSLVHTWVGDLQVSLSNGSTSVIVVNRPGFTGTGFGSSTDLNGSYVIDDEAASGFSAGAIAAGGGAAVLAGGTYFGDNALSAFDGQSVAGTWTLTILDNAGGDNGTLGNWGLTITVPTPGALAVAGLGGLVATRRRR